MSERPQSLKDLIPFLTENPHVRFTNLDGTRADRIFERVADDGLWFRSRTDAGRESYLPVNCRRGAAAAHESGVTFDEAGFTLAKFGKELRVEYVVQPALATIPFDTWYDGQLQRGVLFLTDDRIVVAIGNAEKAVGTKIAGTDGEPRIEWLPCEDGLYLDSAEDALRQHFTEGKIDG